jgi:hypothetical protein
MSKRTLEELLDGELDGTNDAAAQARLQTLLAADPGAKQRREALHRAARALDAAPRAEAPPGLVEAVMRVVRQGASRSRPELVLVPRVLVGRIPGIGSAATVRPLTNPSRGGSMSTKKVLLGVAAAAAIAIGYFAINGYPPVGPGTEGTVGAARKYQSEQISGKDVVLQDTELQQVLQSDALRKLLADKETRALLMSPAFDQAVTAARARALLEAAGRDEAMTRSLGAAAANPAVSALFSYVAGNAQAATQLSAALDNASVQAALAARAAGAAAGSAKGSAAGNALDAALDAAITDKGLSQLLSSAANDQAVAGLLANASVQQAVTEQSFASLLANASFARIIGDAAVMQAVNSASFQNAARSGALTAALEQATGAAAGAASASALDKATDAAREGARGN